MTMSETRLCERCGKPFKAYFYERYCTACNVLAEKEENIRKAQDGEDIDCTEYPVCPWCGEELGIDEEDSAFYEDGDHMMTCPDCQKVFRLDTSVHITYGTSRELSSWMKRELEDREQHRRNQQ